MSITFFAQCGGKSVVASVENEYGFLKASATSPVEVKYHDKNGEYVTKMVTKDDISEYDDAIFYMKMSQEEHMELFKQQLTKQKH